MTFSHVEIGGLNEKEMKGISCLQNIYNVILIVADAISKHKVDHTPTSGKKQKLVAYDNTLVLSGPDKCAAMKLSISTLTVVTMIVMRILH